MELQLLSYMSSTPHTCNALQSSTAPCLPCRYIYSTPPELYPPCRYAYSATVEAPYRSVPPYPRDLTPTACRQTSIPTALRTCMSYTSSTFLDLPAYTLLCQQRTPRSADFYTSIHLVCMPAVQLHLHVSAALGLYLLVLPRRYTVASFQTSIPPYFHTFSIATPTARLMISMPLWLHVATPVTSMRTSIPPYYHACLKGNC